MKPVTPQALRAMLTDGAELALIDVREEGVFTQSHLLLATCIPLSRLEVMAGDLVPRKSVRMVLCDGGDGGEGLAERAAVRFAELGYTDVAILEGGITGWKAAGLELFSGVNVPSKAFGEYVETHDGTPHVTPAELDAMRARGDDLVIVDSRPWEEYHRMNIPGGIDMPGAELVHRIHTLAPDPGRTVVVNCAGRTRSIIGAQSLINAGLPNRVVALENGTMGWELAGFQVENGATRQAPLPEGEAVEVAKARAGAVAKRFGVRTITVAELDRWRAEADSRTLFVLDVRSPEEFASGHRPGSRPAPGGQLVQATDEYVGVRNARLALVDDNGVRATMTASWLIQMGWPEVAVVAGGLDGKRETGPHVPGREAIAAARADMISPADLAALLDTGDAVVVDFATSLQYRAGHIPGAWYAVRARLPADAATLPKAGLYVAASPDGGFARLAASDLAAATGTPVKVLDGGTDAWRASGNAVETGFTNMASGKDDVAYKPYDHDDAVAAEHMQAYITWEVALVEGLKRDGTLAFKRFPPA
jgi:rhodanese-related sulfurtransferase